MEQNTAVCTKLAMLEVVIHKVGMCTFHHKFKFKPEYGEYVYMHSLVGLAVIAKN